MPKPSAGYDVVVIGAGTAGCDASGMPTLPSNNTVATFYALAERGAELVRTR
jgi:choline dehydrogenase-like flavoprotein